MRWKNKKGKLIWHTDSQYKINWRKKAPSKGAQSVKNFFRMYLFNDIWFEEYRLPWTRLKIDFLNATKKFAVEFQGRQHEEYVEFFHGHMLGFADQIRRDLHKIEILENNDYTFVEIFEEDLPLNKKFFVEKYGLYL